MKLLVITFKIKAANYLELLTPETLLKNYFEARKIK